MTSKGLIAAVLSAALCAQPLGALAETPVRSSLPGAVSNAPAAFDGNRAPAYGVYAYSGANPTYAFGNAPVLGASLSETVSGAGYNAHYGAVPSPGGGKNVGLGDEDDESGASGKSKKAATPSDPKAVAGAAILGLAGALLGFALGGPIGACIGFIIGALVGALMAKAYEAATAQKKGPAADAGSPAPLGLQKS